MNSDFGIYSDCELLLLMGKDHKKAFDELFNRYWESLFDKAFHFLQDEGAAKDCIQEVFIWLWTHRGTIDVKDPNNYLHQATRFQAFRVLRERKAAAGLTLRLLRFTEEVHTAESLELKELGARLDRLVDFLPEDQRLVFKLNREESLSYKQIAEKLRISVKTVEKKMSLSLRYLRSHVMDVFVIAAVPVILIW